MKILRITFENLNSLRGKWQINLEDKAYTSDGIFAITGSTGAGKTTIFDAICLALYGCTPRLGNVTSGTNEIMSRGKSTCCAHVTFSVGGKTYTAKWGQAKKKGELQTPEHKLEDTDNSIPLTDKNTETLREIIRLTGMDFKRFTRAMMLEQGHFDSFLTSKKNERAEILELITGTEIYSIISREVYARNKHESSILHDKGIELEAVKTAGGVISREELDAETARKKSELAALESALKSAAEARNWRRDIHRIESDIDRNLEDIDTQQKRVAAFASKRAVLDRAERAASIEGAYSQLKSEREARAKCAEDVRSIQQSIAQRESALAAITEQLPKLSAELEAQRHGLSDPPEVVVHRVESAVRDYLSAVQEKQDSERRLREANGKVAALRNKSNDIALAGKRVRTALDEASLKYDQAMHEFMELSERRIAAILDEERAKLKAGEPCPLCGSTEHPACTHEHRAGTGTGESSQELLARMDSVKLESLKKNLASIQQEHTELTDQWNACAAAISAAMSQASMCADDLQAKIDRVSLRHSAVSEAIRPLRLGELNGTDEVIRQTRAWAARTAQLEQLIQSAQTEKAKIEAALVAENSTLERSSNDLKDREASLAELEASFKSCLAEKNFADENDFASSLPNIKELPALRTEQQELVDRMNMLQSLSADLNQKLADKQAQNVTPKTLEEAEAEYSEREAEVIAAKGDLASLEQKAVEMTSHQARIDELTAEYDAQKLVAQKWSALSKIVGSAKGDIYRVFAQQITLELVVNNANTYLKRMNGRYTLIPGKDDLSINVIDNEQAGAVRPTTNLSGGERFIVSLALALGLSQISGSKAMVDSLFLDEGFGSLDEDSLNTALEALAEIRSEGRIIGIISHVSALKERIAAQINVIPKSEGTSVLEGPGCSKL